MTIARISARIYYLSAILGRRWGLLGYLVKQINHALTGADIAWQANIGPGLRLLHPTGVVIGKFVVIGQDCRIQQGVTIGGMGGEVALEGESPTIGKGVRIGPGARIFGDITIGDGAVIGANAVVRESVKSGHLATGVPAKSQPMR